MAAVLDILQSVHLQVPHSQFSCYLDTVTESARRSAGRTLALCACGIQNLPTQRQHEKLNKLDPNMPELPTSSNAQSRCNGLWMTASRMVSCPVELESTATARLAKTRQRKLHLRAFSLLARYLCGCSGELQHCAETTGCTGAVHSGCAPTLRTANSTGSPQTGLNPCPCAPQKEDPMCCPSCICVVCECIRVVYELLGTPGNPEHLCSRCSHALLNLSLHIDLQLSHWIPARCGRRLGSSQCRWRDNAGEPAF